MDSRINIVPALPANDEAVNRSSNSSSNNSPVRYQHIPDAYNWRNILSFWILGLCNGYGTTVMLSAAYDIIQRFDGVSGIHFLGALEIAKPRECIPISTGIFLLADTLPALIVKSITPFLPLYIRFNMLVTCVVSAIGFAVVAAAQHEWHAMVGIILTAFSNGLGESSSLAYTTKFNKNVILAWSSGSGVAGALSYSALIEFGFKPKSTLLLMLLIPLLQLITFFVGLKEPNTAEITTSPLLNQSAVHPSPSFSEKLRFLPKLLKYVIPLFCVFLFEYIINQGLYDLIFIPNSMWDPASQYRLFQVIYQVSVFVARSSLSLFSTKQIWIMSILQFMNIIFFASQVMYMVVRTISIMLIVIFYEGFLSGAAYINTYNRVANELPIQYKSFGMSLTAISQSFGVVLAGFLAIPIHNEICKTPAPAVLS